tara:strand:+ start:2191 stop:4173 length:1983 start_codon:yes stop_codon:yes gene_type:complete
MSRQVQIQTNFSVGELDPLLKSRIDLQQYYNALQTANNVFIQPQGGIKRRDGLKYLAELPSAANPQNGIRCIPFEYSTSDSYMLVIVNQRIYIFKNKALITNINGSGNDYFAVSALTSAVLANINYAQFGDTIIFTHNDLQPVKIVRGANDATWTASYISFSNIPVAAFTLATSNPSASITPSATSGNITLTASSGVFTSDYVNQYININSNFGRLRVIEFISSTSIKCRVVVNLFDLAAVASGDWELESGYEAAWSSTKGWPTSCTFHESRLFFGGAKSLPTNIWGSRVADYFNFEVGEGLDDEALDAEVVTDSLNAIVNIFSGRDLQVFTTGGEFYVPQSTNDPITPGNFMVKIATRNGIKEGVPVAGLDSGTIFIQRSGKSLNEMIFTDAEQAYTTSTISLMSSHLLNNPSDIAMRRATSTEESDRLFIVNSGDGSLSVYSILRSQNVVAPSKFTTDGTFQAIGVDVDDTYTVVKRTINSANKYFVEIFDSSLHTDAAVYVSATTATATAAHLPSTTVDILNDGNVEAQQTTNGSGVVTMTRASTSNYELGIPFTVNIKTMPVEPRLPSGTVKGFKKRIVQVNAEVYQSKAMTINGQLVPFRKFGEDILDTPVQSYSGSKQIGPLLGFDYEGSITISQSVPLPLTILSLDYLVSLGQ